MKYPDPPPPYPSPLPSPKRLRAGRLKGREIILLLPLQGGGQEGDGGVGG